MLSMHAEANYVRTCLDAGRKGYLLKNAMDLELVQPSQAFGGERMQCWTRAWAPLPLNRRTSPPSPRGNWKCLQLIVHGRRTKRSPLFWD